MYTNKLNNKKYIGQSIHCGKRFDQHFKGNQLIDDIIQLEGIENFNFEILKQVDKPDLSYWEDYYILKHNTMFPNGYNRKWNCSAAIREQIGEILAEEEFAAEESLKTPFLKCPSDKNLLISMPADFNLIASNSMKLFSYLSLISKPISSPENIRMFQHKNLVLSNIQKATGITDKTVKFYLYHLEKEGLVQYKGGGRRSSNDKQTSHIHLQQESTESYQDFVVRLKSESFRVWKERNKKEKEGIYHIPQFSPCLLIPEVILKKLQPASELDLKLYMVCCCYQLEQDNQHLTLEQLRKILGYTQNTANNNAIRQSFCFLQEKDLFEFEEQQYTNSRGTKIPCFEIKGIQDIGITLGGERSS